MTPAKMPYSASIRPRPRKDGSVAFDVRYRHDGQSKTLSFEHQPGAERWANILRQVGPVEAIAFLNLNTAGGVPTVAEYLETYLATKSGIEPRTLEDYRRYMRLRIAPTMGHLPIDAVAKEAIAAWINLMAKEGHAAKSIKNWHGFLSAMFQNAVDDGLVGRNPCARSKLPETESMVEMVFLSPDEFTELLSYIPVKAQPLVLLLASTGLRWGEATALKPADFDLDARTLQVSRAWKSSREQGWYLGPPKTRRGKRPVTLPSNLIPILRPLVESGEEFVFVNNRHQPVRQAKFYEAVWSPARRLANGLPPFDVAKADPAREWVARAKGVWAGREPAVKPLGKWPRVHDLRHSHVGWQLAQGIGIDVISRRLGHESIQTTMDVYGHIALERAARAGDAIGVALAGAMPQIES